MHTPTIGTTVVEHHSHHHTLLRDLHAHLRGWSRWENLVASFSLGVIVLTVLALLYQSMAI